MRTRSSFASPVSLCLLAAALVVCGRPAFAADPTDGKINHILILMLENRTFDSYLGQLANKGFYNACNDDSPSPACGSDQVSGLSCTASNPVKYGASDYTCTNSNPTAFSDCSNDPNGTGTFQVFHDSSYCTTDTDHSWVGSHREFNYCDPAASSGTNNGFYVVNQGASDPLMTVTHDASDGRALGFYDDTDLPFYYSLADTFAIGDRYFCSLLGQTIPNRLFFMAGTAFGHMQTAPDLFPPPGGYTPTTGNMFKSMNAKGVTWKNYFHDLAQSSLFDNTDASPDHFADINELFVDLATPEATDALGKLAPLPQVALIDPPFTQPQVVVPDTNGNVFSSDEHPPKDIQFGQQLVARIVNAVLTSPHYADTALFITYDEHGGFYDHVPPPAAVDPDGILPGDCPVASEGLLALPGLEPLAEQHLKYFCSPPAETKIPFNRLGFRVPFYVVSPYAKRHYVSHTVLDHTSLLAFVEQRFGLSPLTARDAVANLPTDLFDFSAPNMAPVMLTQPGTPKIDPLLDPHCYEGVEVF